MSIADTFFDANSGIEEYYSESITPEIEKVRLVMKAMQLHLDSNRLCDNRTPEGQALFDALRDLDVSNIVVALTPFAAKLHPLTFWGAGRFDDIHMASGGEFEKESE